MKLKVLFGLATLGLFLLLPHKAIASNPPTISFQGKVVNSNGTNVTDGTYSFVFRIYNNSSPTMTTACTSTASCLWQETQASVTVTSGIFQVELGSSCALTSSSCNNSAGGPINFSSNNSLYLTLQFNGDTSGSNGGFMSPLIHLNSIPFALQADNAASLGGIAAANYVQLNPGSQQSGSINVSGTVQAPLFDTATSNGSLGVGTTNAGVITMGNITNTTFLLQTKASSTALQVKNASSFTVLAVDTSANHLKVFDGTATQAYVDIYYNDGASTATIAASSGTTAIGNGTGAINITAGASSAVSITAFANSTWQVQGTSLTLDTQSGSNSTLAVSNSGAGNITLALDSGGVYAVGSSNGSTISACGANNYISSFASTGGITIGGSCSTIASSNLSDSSNIALLNAANTFTNTNTIRVNSTNALQVQNTATQNLLTLDTSGNNDTSSNLANNPSVETAPSSSTDWKLKGTATIAQDTSGPQYGSNSLKITGAATNDGAFDKLNTTLSTSSTYNILFYVKGNNTAGSTATVQAGYSIDGSAETVLCTNTQLVSNNAWLRYSCSFTPTGSPTSSNSIFIKTTDASARTINVDGLVVQLSNTSADLTYAEGNISLQGNITSPLIVQNLANSNNALSVQNAAGTYIFNVDTTDTNLIANPGFELSLAGGSGTGWSALASTTVSRDTSQSYLGAASLKVVIAGATTGGASYNLNPVVTAISTTYTISFFGLLSSGTAPTLQVTYDSNSSNALTCSPSGTMVTTGWTRFSCSIAANATATSTSGLIKIAQTNSAISTWYIDSVQMEAAAAASNYGAGAIALNGVIQSPITFQNLSNSTTAFQIQNSSSLSMFTVDNTNKIIQIGSSTTDANAIQLVLDSYNNATDPSGGINGSMYYNSATGTFRCYQGGAWRNCLGGGPSNQSTATQSPTAGTDTYITNSSVPLPTGGFRGPTGSAQDGSKITWRLIISKTAAGTGASTITIRVGTAGTISDTSRCTAFSTGTPTAVADVAIVFITVYATAGGSATTLNCSANLTHPLAATGWAGAYFTQAFSTQASFDSTPAGTKIGLSFNGGTGTVATFQAVDVTTSNL